eukprot:CAMPEP_0175037838 /NCGR_PEP_ID=MMETSP0005-20121125/24591_1 /TAXON_ID=420556 /ORGANISM="Ochromonas sp., Strain CCMP1393" /LENGTH=276 /DNA_ID=CAMNT_0016299239 /DNA_START=3 /DNA_END=833 /DNA_ORIENTATION=-
MAFIFVWISSFVCLLFTGATGFQTLQSTIKRDLTRPSRLTHLSGTSYRLWDEEGIKAFGPLGKPVGAVLNLVAELLRIQGDDAYYPPEEAKRLLFELVGKCQPNGLNASPALRDEINSVVSTLVASNPTRNPAYSPAMNGFWKMLYSDIGQAGAASSGKLGPFVGDVYQDLDSVSGEIKNILSVSFPPIKGALVARQSVYDSNTWAIEFDRVVNEIAGVRLPTKKFEPGSQIRLWEIVYLDQDLRILNARNIINDSESFLFVLSRELPENEFQVNV